MLLVGATLSLAESFDKKQVATLGIFGNALAQPVPGRTVAELAAKDPTAALDGIYATRIDQADRTQSELTLLRR